VLGQLGKQRAVWPSVRSFTAVSSFTAALGIC